MDRDKVLFILLLVVYTLLIVGVVVLFAFFPIYATPTILGSMLAVGAVLYLIFAILIIMGE